MAHRIVFAPIIAAVLLLGVPAVFADYQESPLLAARVAAGDLPPVEERLPSNPFVRRVEEEIGEYSGTMRLVSQHQWGYGTFFTQGEMPGLFQVRCHWKSTSPRAARSRGSSPSTPSTTLGSMTAPPWR